MAGKSVNLLRPCGLCDGCPHRRAETRDYLIMDYTTKELLKRYAKLALGQPFAPVLLNILVTSVCDMRCTHCFFTDELDDRPRKKLQMKTHELQRISETLGGNLGVLVLAGGEPFTRKDLPEIVRGFYENNKLDSVYLM